MLSKNLIKANQFVLKEKEPVVVDTNELAARRISLIFPELGGQKPQGFQSGLNAPEVDPLFMDMEGEGQFLDLQGEETEAEPEYTGPSPEELIAEAQAEIDEMRKEAEKNISFLKKRSMEEGRQKGYEEGKIQAMAELETAKKELEMQAKAMEQQYQSLIDELEPKFIQTLTGIYEEIFKVDLKDYKKILMHVIANTIRQAEGTKDFLIHISKNDYEKVMEQKNKLMEMLPSQGITIELIEDSTLHENECMIESSSGIYDCGIGTQLEELTRKLRLLSYEG